MKKFISMSLVFVLLVTTLGHALADTLHLPKHLQVIGEEAFSGTESIDMVDVPYGATEIQSHAFADSAMTGIYIPDTVTSIAENAFEGTDAVFHVSPDSYAREYADAHQIPWVSDDTHYQQDVITSLLEMEPGCLARENAELEYLAIMSVEGVTDPEYLAYILTYNQLAAEFNDSLDEYHAELDSLYVTIDDVSALTDAVSVTEGQDGFTCSLDAYQYIIDRAFLEQMSDGAEIQSVESSDDGQYTTIETDTATYYLCRTGNTISLSSSDPGQARLLSSRAAGGDSMLAKLIDVVAQLSSAVASFQTAIDTHLELLDREIDKIKNLQNANRAAQAGLPAGTPANIAAVNTSEAQKRLQELTSNKSKWLTINKAFSKLNIAGTVLNMRSLIANYGEILAIEKHGHPTYLDDKFYANIELSDQMSKEINHLYVLYATDLFSGIVSVVSSVGSMTSLASFNPSGIVPILLNLFSTFASAALGVKEAEMYDRIKTKDDLLHTYLYGRVVDRNTKVPLKGVAVTNGVNAVFTDELGVYELAVTPGTVDLLMRLNGYKTNSVRFTIEAGTPQKVNASMFATGATVYGCVRDRNSGYGIAGVQVNANGSNANTDAYGEYRLDIPVGEGMLYFSKNGYASPDPVPINVVEDQELNIDIWLDPAEAPQSAVPEPSATPGPSDPVASGGIPINDFYFPDDELRFRVKLYDKPDHYNKEEQCYEGDNILSPAERAAVRSINVSHASSLEGIRYFNNLKTLRVDESSLDTLDVSGLTELQTVTCSTSVLIARGCTSLTSVNLDKRLTAMDLSGCTSLTDLSTMINGSFASCTNLYSLNLSGCTSLTHMSLPSSLSLLDMSGCTSMQSLWLVNRPLSSLTASGCTALQTLSCHGTQITELDVSGCTALETLECFDTQITELDLSGCTALKDLRCFRNHLTSLNISGLASLEDVGCFENQLTELDLSGCSSLQFLYCETNALTALDVSDCSALVNLDCADNRISSLNVSGLTQLQWLGCGDNPLRELSVAGCSALLSVSCGRTQLTSLDVSDLATLNSLNCAPGQISTLDISGCTGLSTLSCNDNQLTSLDASDCSALKILACYGNELESLDLSACTELETLRCQNNQLTELTVPNLKTLVCFNNLLTTLEGVGYSRLEYLYCINNRLSELDLSGCPTLNRLDCLPNSQLTALNVSRCTAMPRLDFRNSNLETIIASGCTSATTMNCYDNAQLKTLDLSGCTALTRVDCRGSGLGTLNLSGCTALTELLYYNNAQPGSLDLSGCQALNSTSFNNSVVASLNLTGCTTLSKFTLTNNALVTLNVSGCTSLISLLCNNNHLTSLNVSGCTALSRLNCKYNNLLVLDLSSCSPTFLTYDEGVEIIQ